MTEIAVQPSFSGGEWSPNLYSRVDLAKYRSAAALMENFFVDYRGGASTRPGTKYVIQVFDDANPVRVINYQASFNVGYAVEIGNGYMRFIYQGAPVLETAYAITGATQANPCVLTIVGNPYAIGDWIYVTGVAGMTQLNGRYFKVSNVAGNLVTLAYLDGTPMNSSTFTAYTSGGTAAKVYIISSPYTNQDDLRLIKFAQSVNQMVLCHPNHPPYVLTSISANNWSLSVINIGSTITAPGAPTVTTTLAAGTVNYSYGVTSIDANGQESSMSTATALANKTDIRSNAGTNTIAWTAVSGAVAYNVYEASVNYGAAVPSPTQYGFIGTTRGTTFIDANIAQDFSSTPPISTNPFAGYTVASVTITTRGAYTSVPAVTFTGSNTTPAVGWAVLGLTSWATAAGGSGYVVGDIISYPNTVAIQVDTIGGGGSVASFTVIQFGSITSGSTPTNPVSPIWTSGVGTGHTLNLTWGLYWVLLSSGGSGYASAPTVGFSSGAGAATAVLGGNALNPTVPGFAQQRLVLGAIESSPATFHMSRVGQYFNFDVSLPIASDDAITGTLVSGTLNTIKSFVGSSAGMLIFTDKAVWLLNGGSAGSGISASAVVANPQSYIGANDVPPIVANYDVLFVQSKGSAVRSLTYNVYYNIYTGNDVSVTAAHLFYNYTIDEWCWAEQPFYSAQAIRSDGVILALTYMKDQDFVGWSHYTTDGTYDSICSVTEQLSSGVAVDAVYTVVSRTNGFGATKFIERFAERNFPNGATSAWCVDAGIQYDGAPATTFSGAEHLAGMIVTGLADGVEFPGFTMPTTGVFTLTTPASVVTVGLPYTCKLQTLPLDVGEPSVQGRPKKISAVDFRVTDTLGLSVGSSFSTLTDVKDLILGNVSSALTGQPSQIVTDLVTGDAFTILDPTYTIPGQYCFQQSVPYPATITGVFPRFTTEARNER